MTNPMNRRDWLRALGAGEACGVEQQKPVGESSGFESTVLSPRKIQENGASLSLIGGKVIQPQRELPALRQQEAYLG